MINNVLLLCLLLGLHSSIHIVSSLRLTSVVIPEYVILGKGGILECGFELGLEDSGLYALKWYKDNDEFFRFKPSDQPHITVFPLKGVTVNVSGSSINKVRLDEIAMSSAGVYRCEISAEAPSFQTLGEDHLLRVIALPERGPTISGLHPWTNVGEELALSCHIHRAFPSPSLSWLVNKAPIRPSSCGGCVRGETYEAGKGEDGTTFYSSTSHLALRVDSTIIRDGSVTLECRASFPHSNVTLTNTLHSNIKAGLGLAHYAHTLANSTSPYSTPPQILLLLPFLTLLLDVGRNRAEGAV
ncbi:uncharacterized protein LOC110861439 [Folsomia candida]|uniref:uncharacterized protein LOC110861439 n=1 Tax=Folsomia candida TaxID=158441 RepID=UPI000B8F9072|nr:uncharacterized protein LOC110861439 [Folsomia candida]